MILASAIAAGATALVFASGYLTAARRGTAVRQALADERVRETARANALAERLEVVGVAAS